MSGKHDNRDIEREHFDALARAEGEIWWGSTTVAGIKRLERRAQIVKAALDGLHEPKVLEVGCGTGAFSKYILSELPELDLTACDISPECVKLACERYHEYRNAKFVVGDATTGMSTPMAFDLVLGNSVLHHLPLGSSLGVCLKALKPGGSILFFEPNMMNPQIFLEKNVRFIGKALQNTENETAFFRWGLAVALRASGFERIAVTPFDFLHPLVPSGAVRFFDGLGRMLENTPLLKEISGSLLIKAFKPR